MKYYSARRQWNHKITIETHSQENRNNQTSQFIESKATEKRWKGYYD